MFTIHRLVAGAFIENPENKLEVDHINRIKTDNRVENLRWATRSEQNVNRKYPTASGYRNIQARKDGYFSVRIYRNGSTYFRTLKTLDEAVKVRDELLNTL